MKKTTKIKAFVFLLAALAAISAVVFNSTNHAMRQIREAKVAAQLEHDRQQVRMDDDDYRRQEALEQKRFNEQVEAIRKQVHAYAGDESKSLTNPKP